MVSWMDPADGIGSVQLAWKNTKILFNPAEYQCIYANDRCEYPQATGPGVFILFKN